MLLFPGGREQNDRAALLSHANATRSPVSRKRHGVKKPGTLWRTYTQAPRLASPSFFYIRKLGFLVICQVGTPIDSAGYATHPRPSIFGLRPSRNYKLLGAWIIPRLISDPLISKKWIFCTVGMSFLNAALILYLACRCAPYGGTKV